MSDIEHQNHCPERGDRRCDCAWEARVRADERAKVYRPDAHRMMVERDAANDTIAMLYRDFETVIEERNAARAELAALRALVADGIEAFRLTKEYVNVPDEHGFVLLPDVPGWSHWDWTVKARAVLEEES